MDEVACFGEDLELVFAYGIVVSMVPNYYTWLTGTFETHTLHLSDHQLFIQSVGPSK